LWGVGDTTGVGVAVGDASVVGFSRVRLGFGEAAGDSAAEGDGVLSADEVVSIVLCGRGFGGEWDSIGVPVSSCDSTRVTQMVRPITKANEANLVAIKPLGKSSSCGQQISENVLILIASYLVFGLMLSGIAERPPRSLYATW
jgi:hypothetical protein